MQSWQFESCGLLGVSCSGTIALRTDRRPFWIQSDIFLHLHLEVCHPVKWLCWTRSMLIRRPGRQLLMLCVCVCLCNRPKSKACKLIWHLTSYRVDSHSFGLSTWREEENKKQYIATRALTVTPNTVSWHQCCVTCWLSRRTCPGRSSGETNSL